MKELHPVHSTGHWRVNFSTRAFSTLSGVLASFPELVKKYFIVSINLTCDAMFAKSMFIDPLLLILISFVARLIV